ncbi:Hypp4773 [Branchiostoma lanceolatum]|uniref:Hypp4773 protein n=1 Tax=Branchiostoma lanceolatum TaxID=7740 RepID=A0A8K0AAQ7_BRALA|nr:Hypp4773 [Branchiostoma lanceolatum]
MSDVENTVLFYIGEEDDYSPKAEAQDSDNEDSGTQTLYTVDDIEGGLQQFERERHGEVTDQPKFPGSKGVEPISVPEMVTKDAPVDEKLGAPPNDTDRLYTIEDILEALETEDGHLALKDKQEKKISLRTEESKKTVKAMRDGCRKRMKEEERRIRKRTWRKYSLDSLNSDKMSAALSGEKQEFAKKQDDEKLSERLPQLVGYKVNPVSKAEKIDDRNAACKLAGTSESSDVRLTTDGVPCSDERVTKSDSHDRLSSEENGRSVHEQNMGKGNLNARGKVRRLFAGFRRVCRRLCCISDTSGSDE